MFNAFRIAYGAAALSFVLAALVYIVDPGTAYGTLDRVNRALGGGAFPTEGEGLWHLLGVGNVMALAFMCALLWWDLRRFYAVLPALLFLKGFSALFGLLKGLGGAPVVFYAIFLLDGATFVVLWFFATRGHRALELAPRR